MLCACGPVSVASNECVSLLTNKYRYFWMKKFRTTMQKKTLNGNCLKSHLICSDSGKNCNVSCFTDFDSTRI